MRSYIIRRLLLIIPVLFFVTLIIFFLTQFFPGSLVDQILSEMQYQYKESDVEAIKKALGVELPVHMQYLHWIGGVVRGDLGTSMWTSRPVNQLIAEKLPVSFELGLFALITALIIAIPIGVYSAIRQDTPGDYVGRTFAILCISLPSFWLGTVVVVYPSIWWHWTPSLEYIPFVQDPVGNLKQFILPGFILGMVMSGTTMRMTRTMMLEVLRQDYIRTAWSKGLAEHTVIIRHGLKNALIPVVTIVGLQLPVLIGGSVILEQIFCLPGIGRLLIEALNKRDYIVISGINVVMASFVLLVNLLADLTYAYLDPRIHYR